VDRASETVAAPGWLGKYELIGHLATGGMAEIHLARVKGIEGFQKVVVLKRILPALADNPEIVQLFLDEARLAATLQHSNIVQVYDVGVSDGSYFFTMEHVHGEDVRTILRTAGELGWTIGLSEALTIVLGMCAGLHYAHEKVGFDGNPLGIIHRDVSPSNVLVSYDGLVKVVDFGIAKAASRSSETQHGSVRGKFGYMSPEQCESRPLDRRSDLFAIAIVLYELTTSTKLFRGDSDYAIMKQIVEHPAPPPSTRRPGYPPELERIVMKGLERDRDRRYATAQEMQIDLETFVREQRLAISTVTMARFMEELFGRKIDQWRAAQKRGLGLIEHLQQTMTARTPSFSAVDVLLETKSASPVAVPRKRARKRNRALAIAATAALVVAAIAIGATRARSRAPKPTVAANVGIPIPQLSPIPPKTAVAPVETLIPTQTKTGTIIPSGTGSGSGSGTKLAKKSRTKHPAVETASTKKEFDPDSPVPP